MRYCYSRINLDYMTVKECNDFLGKMEYFQGNVVPLYTRCVLHCAFLLGTINTMNIYL